MSALGGIVQLKSIAIEERPVWRLHWSAFSSQKECVWQLTRFASRKWRPGLNRISHPDWVKLSVELNCAPNQNTKFFFSLQSKVNFSPLSAKNGHINSIDFLNLYTRTHGRTNHFYWTLHSCIFYKHTHTHKMNIVS